MRPMGKGRKIFGDQLTSVLRAVKLATKIGEDATGAVTGTAEKAGSTVMDAGKGLLNTAKAAVEGVGNTAKSAGETVLETGKALINKNPVKAAE